MKIQGYPKKTPVFLNGKYFPDILSENMEGKIVEIATFDILEIGRPLWKNL